ncbi:DUF4268 domain-containing protein [Peptoniphilus gorbachii]|uniref:Uncharacterized protein with ParB-like and HNH nuclease domain n=1 Tax=Peptoniphilus gorbachii TaxID=411567 RepID=A0ABS2MHL8_9FIRM|nr:DUF4268 domain-containing protein [Peptoniphilus gorbachii]MBM7549499.1 uncharacterized protein with ParB-like and HNH nuclease domain [Peptoniphilus gorbachii]
MKGDGIFLFSYMEGSSHRYVIPVYQRRYDWKIDNCKQLYNDLIRLTKNGGTHFFGSIVSDVKGGGATTEFYIIDGQQRLTTVTLLLLALAKLVEEGEAKSNVRDLSNQIMERFIISKWADMDNRIKLIPVKRDRQALYNLIFEAKEDYIENSNLTINFKYFYDRLKNDSDIIDEIYYAIQRLQVISITLDKDDDAQLIFESLNSTGLALSEGDKIRNFILMNLPLDIQNDYFEKYWIKIEDLTNKKIDNFVRNYLSIKTFSTPTMAKVYLEFKDYVNKHNDTLKDLLEDMLRYSKFYNKLMKGDSSFNTKALDDTMFNMNKMEITVTEPFFMEVFSLHDEGKLSVDDLIGIFTIVEIYLFRRNICGVATNALNKIFLNLNKDIIRYDGSTDNYVEKLKYNLTNKKESGRFPKDEEFYENLSNKDIYLMRGRFKNYLFNKIENYGTVETKDIYNHLDSGTYSIEHIMPQKLNNDWFKELGDNAEEIHEKWIHKLGNLTITGYNSDMGNSSFEKKRDGSHGFKKSGIRMNQDLALLDSWGEDEIEKRHEDLLNLAVNEIWKYPISSYKPIIADEEYISLDDDYDLKGKKLIKINFRGEELFFKNWAEAFTFIIKTMHEEDKSKLINLVAEEPRDILGLNFFTTSNDLRSFEKIDENIFVSTNNNTNTKIKILEKLFELYNEGLDNLVFYFEESENFDRSPENLKEEYWNYAIPIIKEANIDNETFRNVNITKNSWVSGAIGINRFYISCYFYMKSAKVSMVLNKSDKEKNKAAFDYLYKYKESIENNLGYKLSWNRLDDKKVSTIDASIENINSRDKSNWEKIAKFHADMSDAFYKEFVPRLREFQDK